ncbi:hypothetical protein N0V82_000149 [Gnomoniopsis sp. IMI 355080]|nr:hypothetical protein N0V82_000149 [Gnomoniopsis sp. IMI 355080]
MNDHDKIPDEPPPSYQEATGNPSHTYRPSQEPPPLPPRQSSSKPTSNTETTTPTSPSASTHPPQTFAQLLPRSHTVNRQFPPNINLYRHDAFPGAISRRYFLGEHQHSPLYAVGVWQSWATQASLVLHNGPSEDYPPLATVAFDAYGRRMDVTLPPLPGESRAQPITVTAPTLMSSTIGFRVEVPWPTGPDGSVQWRKEAFEWRRSNSLAVNALGGSAQGGWKLVRLSRELPPGGLMVAGSGPPSGDGFEVVAACTTSVMSLTKLWKFCFLGTGVSGALGERWAVMAVTSGLVTWDRENRR